MIPVVENQLERPYSLAQADQRKGIMTRTFISQLPLRKASVKAAVGNLSALRRVLHLIWELVWPNEIVWNSEQKLERLRTIRKHLHAEK